MQKTGQANQTSPSTSKMVTPNSIKDQTLFLTKKFLPWTLYIILPFALLRLLFSPLRFLPSPDSDDLPHSTLPTIPSLSSPPRSSSDFTVEEARPKQASIPPCDYFNGKWVRDKRGPLYNDTTCSTIKHGQNCLAHGRPDLGYLYWRWKPNQCNLPRFDPLTFLQLLTNKHLAFVGDSLARNQLESLLCLISSVSTPVLLYQKGEENKFRRWIFPSHNLTLSIYWSPFLVKGIEKSSEKNYNKLYLDVVDERWASELTQIDMIVLAIGHWFLLPAFFYEFDSVLGCHYCPGMNHTEIGFYEVFRKALRTALNSIIERKSAKGDGIDVTVTTFSPSHFEGEWDKAGACPKTKPYRKGEKEVGGMDSEMRKVGIEEVEAAKEKAKNYYKYEGLGLEALDVTKLALMRPDGHPGPYMNPFPFGNGGQNEGRVQNDCVHWCLPGPIDAWNEIFLEMVKKWRKNNEDSTEMDGE